jgi:sRNA-binding carbon storage regulator CsrA
MIKIHRYEPKNNEEVLVVKNGVTYRVLDLGGSKIEIRVKTPKEILKDKNEFRKYTEKINK